MHHSTALLKAHRNSRLRKSRHPARMTACDRLRCCTEVVTDRIFRLAQLTMTVGALPMLKFFKFLFRRRPSEPLPADAAELNSALEKLRVAFG